MQINCFSFDVSCVIGGGTVLKVRIISASAAH